MIYDIVNYYGFEVVKCLLMLVQKDE